MKLTDQPMTAAELREATNNGREYVTAQVPIDLDTLIDNDLEGVLDALSFAVTDSPLLMDITYRVVSAQSDHAIIIEVTGDASQVLDSSD